MAPGSRPREPAGARVVRRRLRARPRSEGAPWSRSAGTV